MSMWIDLLRTLDPAEALMKRERKMTDVEILEALSHLKVQTGSLACMGCGYEHNCGVHGCTILREAAGLIEKLTDRCARYAEEIAVLQEREKWVPVTERLPEVWRNDETSELVNYMIYRPDFGVDIGNYHANAKNGFAWHYLAPSRTGGRCRMGRRLNDGRCELYSLRFSPQG